MYVYIFYFRDYVCYFKKINEKLWENKTIYRWLYYIPIIKLKIMLNEPFMLSMVWKSNERFGNLSLEKYLILKWKM